MLGTSMINCQLGNGGTIWVLFSSRSSISTMDSSDFISTEQISAVHPCIVEMKSELSIAEIERHGWGQLRDNKVPGSRPQYMIEQRYEGNG